MANSRALGFSWVGWVAGQRAGGDRGGTSPGYGGLYYGGLYLPNATFKRFAKTDLDASTTTNDTPTNHKHPTIGPTTHPINKYKARKESREERRIKNTISM